MLRKAAFISIATVSTLAVMPPAGADETGLANIHEQRREGNRICMSSHFHNGSSSDQKTRKLAEAAAARDWSGFTVWEYGKVWGSFRLAASKSTNCERAAGTWSCKVKARPCRPLPKR